MPVPPEPPAPPSDPNDPIWGHRGQPDGTLGAVGHSQRHAELGAYDVWLKAVDADLQTQVNAFGSPDDYDPAGAANTAESNANSHTDSALKSYYARLPRVAATPSSGAIILASMQQNVDPIVSGFTSTIGGSRTGLLSKTGHGFAAGDRVRISGASNTVDDIGNTLNNQQLYIVSDLTTPPAYTTTGTNIFLARSYLGTPIGLTGTVDTNITLTLVGVNMGLWVLWKDWYTVNPSKVLQASNPTSGILQFMFDITPGMGTGDHFWIAGVGVGYDTASATGYTVNAIMANPDDGKTDGRTVQVIGTGQSGRATINMTSGDSLTGSVYLWQPMLNDIAAAAAASPAKQVVVAVPAGSATPWWVANAEVRGNVVRSVFGAGRLNAKAHYSDVPIPWNTDFQNAYQQMLVNFKAVVTAAGLYGSFYGFRIGGICRDTIEARVPDEQGGGGPSTKTLTNLTHFCYGVRWDDAEATTGQPATGAGNPTGPNVLHAKITKIFCASDVGAIPWGSISRPNANGMPNCTITQVANDGSWAIISANVTSAYTVPAGVQMSLKRDVTGLGYTNSNCAMDWLYLVGAKNVVGTSRYGKYTLVANGGCATVVGTDGTGYTTAKLGSKPGSVGAWDAFITMYLSVFNGTEKLIGAYLTKTGFPNVEFDPSDSTWKVYPGDESQHPGDQLPLSGDPPQWAVLVDKACVAYGARGIHTQQALNETINYDYWSNQQAPSVQTHFVTGSTEHASAKVGFQFQEAEFNLYPEPDYPPTSTGAFEVSMGKAINRWAASYVELWPPMVAAYEAVTAQYLAAALRSDAANILDTTGGTAIYVLPNNPGEGSLCSVEMTTASTNTATIKDQSNNTVIVLTRALPGALLQFDATTGLWWPVAVYTSQALLDTRYLTTPPTADTPWGGNKITGLGNGVAVDDAAALGQVRKVGHFSVRAVTAAILPNTPAYNNGTAGVGATLQSSTNAALVVDGVTLALNDRILVTTQASALQNGIYTLTQLGSGSVHWILTRATDFDETAEAFQGGLIACLAVSGTTAGSTLNKTLWVVDTTASPTIGTTSINFQRLV